jgi:hypothetical protein
MSWRTTSAMSMFLLRTFMNVLSWRKTKTADLREAAYLVRKRGGLRLEADPRTMKHHFIICGF